MIFSDITDGNINLYAMKVYDNPQCIDEAEYHEDMKKTTYIKRLFNHYRLTGELKSRLILNHLIVFANVFPARDAARILFFKIHEEYYPILKPFLVSLSMMPDRIEGIRGKNIYSSDIFMDDYVIQELRKL
jgi:hypothetical protein|tara:strand:- start:4242 stop:4634 length:393 start_codon:yes stop_codon:yes gene_type:complete